MSSKRDEPLTAHLAVLRAIEHIARARQMLMLATGSFGDDKSYPLFQKVIADLDVASKETQTLLGYTRVDA